MSLALPSWSHAGSSPVEPLVSGPAIDNRMERGVPLRELRRRPTPSHKGRYYYHSRHPKPVGRVQRGPQQQAKPVEDATIPNSCKGNAYLKIYNPIDGDDKVTSGSVDHAFCSSGKDLFVVLRDILQHTWECDQEKWLASLYEWRERVKHCALTLLNTIDMWAGSRDWLYHTIPLSIYMWWRVCKMVADIEVIAENKKHYISGYFELMADLFLELWVGFVPTIERDLRVLNLTVGKVDEGISYQPFPLSLSQAGRESTHSALSSRHTTVLKFRHLSFLQDPDMLPDVNSGHEFQQHEIHEEGSETQWMDLVARVRAKRIYAKLNLFFRDAFLSYDDFKLTAIILSANAVVRSENGGHKKTSKRPSNHLCRPFKKWRDEVRAAISTPDIDRRVTRMYQDLLRHSRPVSAIYHGLLTLLGSTPRLFRSFKLLVPRESLQKWTAAERDLYEMVFEEE